VSLRKDTARSVTDVSPSPRSRRFGEIFRLDKVLLPESPPGRTRYLPRHKCLVRLCRAGRRFLCVRANHPEANNLTLASVAKYPFCCPSGEMAIQHDIKRI
jgi:hypothetical protein